MRWLLAKDLTILRRSPLLTALLVIYPIVIAILIGFALSGGPSKPRVAFLNQVPEDTPLNVGGESFDIVGARDELCDRIECVRVETEEEARELVESGEVLGALILPEDLITKLQSLGGLTPEQPTVTVLVNEEDPVKGQLVDDRISTLLSDANLRVSQQISDVSIGYLGILLNGGSLAFLGDDYEILGLRSASELLTEVRENLPPGAREDAADLDRVIRFADLAAENLDVADDLLGAVSQPIQVDKEIVRGGSSSLDTFAISVAATITLMFVTVLLVAGSLALEREENAFGRLVRNLITPFLLLTEKILLGVVVALAVTLVMLLGLELFVNLEWSRFPLWIPAILAGGAGFAAFGAAIGGAAKEVRASSLLAFMISLPVAFLSLVPSGTVGNTAYDLIEIVTGAFPFDPALRALSSALESGGPSLLAAIAHLAILTLAYGALARVALRRLA
jgi:ABC-2 type transport system permease protein